MMTTNPLKFITKHWIKCLVIAPAVSAATYYGYDFKKTTNLMSKYCEQVSKIGDEKLKSPTSEVRHVTVLLNPIAGKRKSKRLYRKWVEPLLHLSGTKVSLVETETINQAFDLMKIMSNCDAVAIVGGDGTVNEAINGLLSRPDANEASSKFPVAIIPAGKDNIIAKKIYEGFVYRNHKELLIHTTMGLIKSVPKSFESSEFNIPKTEESDQDDDNVKPCPTLPEGKIRLFLPYNDLDKDLK